MIKTSGIHVSKTIDFSSAEMTAYWRSKHSISKDKLSIKMTSFFGKEKSHEFEDKYQYPLIGRKVSARARFFLDNADNLLHLNKYDSCISLASGFSLLTYYILRAIKDKISPIKFFDTDISDILIERERRLVNIDDLEFKKMIKNIELKVLDLEEASRTSKKLKDIFPTCERPVFLIEGVIYFLSSECVKWLFSEISTFDDAGLIFDYWPEEGFHQSKCFFNTVNDLRGFMRENVVSYFTSEFWGSENFSKLTSCFNTIHDIKMMQAENDISDREHEKRQLVNQNEFFPVNLYVGQLNIDNNAINK